jgi:hypothetical protein
MKLHQTEAACARIVVSSSKAACSDSKSGTGFVSRVGVRERLAVSGGQPRAAGLLCSHRISMPVKR